MPDSLKIVGYGRSKYSDEELRNKVGAKLDISDEDKEKFLSIVRFRLELPILRDQAYGFAGPGRAALVGPGLWWESHCAQPPSSPTAQSISCDFEVLQLSD